MSNFLWPHELQHSRLPCPLLCPRVCLNSCPFNQWCHPIIASSVAPYLSCLRLFQWVGTWHQVAKALELHLQHKSFQWIFRADFLWDWLVWSPRCPRTLKSLIQQHNLKASLLRHSIFYMIQLSHTYMTTRKNIALTRWTFFGKKCNVSSF